MYRLVAKRAHRPFPSTNGWIRIISAWSRAADKKTCPIAIAEEIHNRRRMHRRSRAEIGPLHIVLRHLRIRHREAARKSAPESPDLHLPRVAPVECEDPLTELVAVVMPARRTLIPRVAHDHAQLHQSADAMMDGGPRSPADQRRQLVRRHAAVLGQRGDDLRLRGARR